MSQFIVSARKYRPARFEEVVGQDHVTRTLKNAIRQGKVAHAFLFCGPRGVGKTTTARILAKTINCENITEDIEACGKCASCISFEKKNAPNIIELDAASNNSVENIRTLIDQVRIPPAQGQYKLFIIDEVHMLSSSAFNAFLKTLEEPPSFAIFILATTEKHKILPTILSRCQIYDFKRNQVRDIIPHLESICASEQLTYDEEALHLIAEKADGALRDALSIFDRIVSFVDGHISYEAVIDQLNILDHDYYFRLTDEIISAHLSGTYLLFDEILKKGFDPEVFLLGFQEHLRQLLMIRLGGTDILVETSDRLRNRYKEQAARTSRDLVLTLMDLANDCDVHFRFAQNKRLHVEICLMKMVYAPYALEQGALPSPEETVNSDLPKKKRKQAEDLNTGSPLSESHPGEIFEEQIPEPPVKEPEKEHPSEITSQVGEPEIPVSAPGPVSAEAKKRKPKKKLLPSLDSMAALKTEVEQDYGTEIEEKNGDELFGAIMQKWNLFITNHNSPSLISYMKDSVLRWEGDNNLHITVPSQLAKASILDQRDLFEELRAATEPYVPEIIFEINPDSQPVRETPVILSVKDKYEALKKTNPMLDDLIRTLQLKIDPD